MRYEFAEEMVRLLINSGHAAELAINHQIPERGKATTTGVDTNASPLIVGYFYAVAYATVSRQDFSDPTADDIIESLRIGSPSAHRLMTQQFRGCNAIYY